MQNCLPHKPAGLVVHPGCGNYHGTLVNAIAWHLRDVPTYNPNDPQVGLVHRIDKDTSGLLVVAKTPDAKTSLGLQFYNKTTKREYNALVWGIVEQDEGTITGNIGRNPRDRMQMAVMSDPEQGKHAVTHYQGHKDAQHDKEHQNAHVAAVRKLGHHAAVLIEEQGVDGQLQIAVGI